MSTQTISNPPLDPALVARKLLAVRTLIADLWGHAVLAWDRMPDAQRVALFDSPNSAPLPTPTTPEEIRSHFELASPLLVASLLQAISEGRAKITILNDPPQPNPLPLHA